VLLVGGQYSLVATAHEASQVTAVDCHATCTLLRMRLSTDDLP
jgi:hypothetical protein